MTLSNLSKIRQGRGNHCVNPNQGGTKMKRLSKKVCTFPRIQMFFVAMVALSFVGCAGNGAIAKSGNAHIGGGSSIHQESLPSVGLGAYTMSHAKNQSPPERLGGPVTITAVQEGGSTRWPLPGPRQLDPAVFGTPDHPLGWEAAPFPLVGIPHQMRQQRDGNYTIVDHATPFSDWMKAGVGSLRMTVTDRTAIDGATTQDKVDFEATFQSPDQAHDYRVVANMPLPHGKFFPTFGGVVTDHLLHGSTGIGTKLMPTEYTYVSFWAKGQVFVDGKLTNDGQLVHVMITEFVRGDRNKLQFDGSVGAGGTGMVLHLMVPPYRIGPKGPEKSPVRSGYIPFPEIQKKMMKAKDQVMKLPADQRDEKMKDLEATKALMMKTKHHVQEAMAAGKMFGQPFFHVMFGHVELNVAHEG